MRACALQPVALAPILSPLAFRENSVDILETLLSRATRSSFGLHFAAPDLYLRSPPQPPL